MRHFRGCLLLLACVLFLPSLSFSQNWQKKAPFPGSARGNVVSVVSGNKAYVGLGYYSKWGNGRETYYKDFWMYDPAVNQWVQKSDFPGGERSNAVAFTKDGKIYVGLGSKDSIYFKDFYEYTPTTDQWKKVFDFPGSARNSALTFTVDSIVYVGAGFDGTTVLRDFYKFDNTLWSEIASLPNGQGRFKATAYSLEGYGYVAGGDSLSGVMYPPGNIYRYTPSYNQWEEEFISSALGANLASYVSKDTAYIWSGQTMYKYNFWDLTSVGNVFNVSKAFSDMSFFVVNGVPYMVCGNDGKTYYSDLWCNVSNTLPDPTPTNNGHKKVKIYPSPATDYITVDGVTDGDADIINSTGSVVKQVKLTGNQVDVSTLTSGTYTIKIHKGTTEVREGKFLKKK